MSIGAKTLINMAKKEEVSRFMAALQKAKEDVDGARAYAHLNPVCSKCQKSGDPCLKWQDGIRCNRCRTLKQGCPRVVDFYISQIARRLGQSEVHVRELYSLYGANKRPRESTRSSPSRASGSMNSKGVAVKPSRETVIVVDDEEQATEDSNEEDHEPGRKNRDSIHAFFPPQPKMKASGHGSTSGTNHREAGSTHSGSRNELELQKKEMELLKRRAETAEGNFVALVGRVQDFRTSLRSEIRTMPVEVDSDGLSKLSAAMETTIDDAGLYLRNISDALKQSRSNWEINYGTKAEGGSKEPRASGSGVRQVRQRSPVPDGKQKRQRI
ncbi:hypothetical protein BYT27DRAFT_7204995 [Phlegmacium glaucopus]|nr:hypothetical protein BYT27DRAFT_7204995 [Phlegmacium glaucopus]